MSGEARTKGEDGEKPSLPRNCDRNEIRLHLSREVSADGHCPLSRGMGRRGE